MYKYRIAVCDDEKLIRNGICKFIDESFENAEIVASLSDGEEVIELLKTSSVDIVITDIRMKKVDGIAVAEYTAENICKTLQMLEGDGVVGDKTSFFAFILPPPPRTFPHKRSHFPPRDKLT